MTRYGNEAAPSRPGSTGDRPKDLAEIKSDVRVLKWITGTTLAGVLALVIRTFTS